MNLLCFDPGRTTGFARFIDDRLTSGFSKPREEILESPPPLNGAPRESWIVLIELPRWYAQRNKIDANDLIDLGLDVGDLRGHYKRQGCTVELIPPRDWKGTVDSDIMLRWILEALTESEKKYPNLERRPRQKSYNHNMLDAVGMGLKKLGRLR